MEHFPLLPVEDDGRLHDLKLRENFIKRIFAFKRWLEIIDLYRLGTVPLIVPITLVNHYVRKYEQPYLKEQYYLHPHPLELQLRKGGER
jgi:uncharacterized protein YbgA (DUF1722 family)